MLIAAPSCRHSDNSWQRVQESGVLRVGLDPTFPPFAHFAGEEVVGLDVDLAQAVAVQLGLNMEIVIFGYDSLYDALASKQVDVLVSALVVQPERTRDFAYSTPYFNAGQILVVPESNHNLQNIDELTSERIAVELGAEGHVIATTWAKRLPEVLLLQFNSVDKALTAVANGQAEAAIVDSVGGRLFLREHSDLKWLPAYVQNEPYTMVVRVEDDTLLSALNEALAGMENAGTLAQIESRWLDD